MPSPISNPATTGQINDAVKLGRVLWHEGADMEKARIQEVRSLFWEKHADEYTEEHSSMTESGGSHKTGEGEDYKLVSDTQGDSLTLTQQKRTVRRIITEDLLEFNKYPVLSRKLMVTGAKLWRGYAWDLTHRFTFAFDTSYTDRDGETVSTLGGDGAALIANTHTLNSGDTFDNLISARLSESSLEDAEDLMSAFIDQNGELVSPIADTLITCTHSATKHMAERINGQPWQPDSDFRNKAVYQGRFRHIVLPYLDTANSNGAVVKDSTKSRFWFIMDSSLKDNLVASVRRFPVPDFETRDPDNNNMTVKAKMWYDIGHLDSNMIVGSNAV